MVTVSVLPSLKLSIWCESTQKKRIDQIVESVVRPRELIPCESAISFGVKEAAWLDA